MTSSQRRTQPAHNADTPVTVEWQPRPPDGHDLALSRLLFGEPQEASRG